jgi:hypothetical protein
MALKALTQNDIIALKQADHVIISLVYIHGKQNVARILCAKQIAPEEFKTWEIYAASAIMFLDDSLIVSNAECQITIANSCVDWVWQSIVGQLFFGDELEVLWNPDEYSSYESVQAGWHGDSVKLIIYRNQFRFHFLIGTKVTTDENRCIKGLRKQPTQEMF